MCERVGMNRDLCVDKEWQFCFFNLLRFLSLIPVSLFPPHLSLRVFYFCQPLLLDVHNVVLDYLTHTALYLKVRSGQTPFIKAEWNPTDK